MHSSIQYPMSQIHQSDLLAAAQRSETVALARGRATRRLRRSVLGLAWTRPRAAAAPAPTGANPLRVFGRAAL